MPAPDASSPARDAIDAFIQQLADRGLSATTRRIRKTYLGEYLRHAQQAQAASDGADGAEGPEAAIGRPLTAGDLMDGERAAAWLADAAAGKTRTRATSRGPEATAYPNSMRVRIDSVNAFAEFIGDPVADVVFSRLFIVRVIGGVGRRRRGGGLKHEPHRDALQFACQCILQC